MEEQSMFSKCEVKEQPAQFTLSIRTRTAVQNLPQVFGAGYGAIAQYLGERGEQPAGPPFAAYYNIDMADLDVELGFPVTHPVTGRGEIEAGDIPGGKVATCLYTGPYSDIEQAYTAISEWMQGHGHAPIGVAYEQYLNDPNETDPADLQTRIIFPLQDA
jgi:effector-binding domain-containing protein